ncbi:MAG: double-strand break repair protein AddB, partial [Devosia sp.]
LRTFGGESAEEEPFLPPVDAPPARPQSTRQERRLTLARLIGAFANSPGGASGFASPPNPSELFWLADSLGSLIDDLEIEGVSYRALRDLVTGDLAQNWQEIVRFLDLALDAWPKISAERGHIDAALARNERLLRQAAAAPLLYDDRPVIAAGSTGSIPATAALLDAIARLERGAVVLPGLDTTLSPTQHEMLLSDVANPHGHAQYGLAKLLSRLGAGIADVEELAADASPRTQLVRSALALPDDTPNWQRQRDAIGDADFSKALAGLTLLAARNADLEARAIAMAARAAIAEGKTVGIVTPDQTLARRIAAELRRFAIAVDDPAGTPLYQSPIGRLARQALAVTASRFGAVELMGLLRHKAVTLGLDRGTLLRNAEFIERLLLRGQFPPPGIAGLRRHLAGRAARLNQEIVAALDDIIDRIERALAPLATAIGSKTIDAGGLAAALLVTLDALGPDIAKTPGYGEFSDWAKELVALDAAPFPPVNPDGVLAALMAGMVVRNIERRRDDIFIWGTLEARLQNPDLMIVAGLNEGTWPAAVDPGPWLSRQMRLDMGLSPPERQQGQAAHDFEMAIGNTEVILAYALRLGSAPALPSRLVQRLMAFIGEQPTAELRGRGDFWIAQVDAIDLVGMPVPANRPAPNPPPAVRPRRLSITEIEPMMRSPYDIYAKHVLRLQRLEPLGAQPSARERGTMIHAVFERFVVEGRDFAAPDASATLTAMAEDAFSGLDMIEERRAIWLKRFARAGTQFLDYERQRDRQVWRRAAERKAEWPFPALDGFVLVGKADRIDLRRDGTLEIIDYKTGGVPAPKEMTAYEAPQLLLEAAMARAGMFAPDVPPAPSSALTYIKIGLGPAAFQIKPFRTRPGVTITQAVDEIEQRLQRHVEAFLLGQLPMSARIRPRVESGRKSYPGDYDH